MGKAADLSEFDRGQIVMARRLGTSITETVRLVGCSRYAVVSIHAKWINDVTPAVDAKVLVVHASSKKKDIGDCPACGPRNTETGPCMSGRDLPSWMNPDFSFITSMVVSGYAVCQANSCFPLVQQVIHKLVVAVLCFGGRSHGRLWDP
ncbi:hypothetical protein AVEN_31177-1 [Araneus ventricosus]|uniref:Uncharacterized protein n=1 Tax=Araneus ventricosus TaxID=182803 RepID=A0A4Y2UT59_ARAVE|nr:hypothetical protein AVEN_31177-1 [Araneus ventricosus]